MHTASTKDIICSVMTYLLYSEIQKVQDCVCYPVVISINQIERLQVVNT